MPGVCFISPVQICGATSEFNLNLPRYVDTFEPEKVLLLNDAAIQLKTATEAAEAAQSTLMQLLASIVNENQSRGA